MALLPREKKRTEVFVCDHCGMRKRLPRDQRHWCEECKMTPPVELRLTRSRLHYKAKAQEPAIDAATLKKQQNFGGWQLQGR